MDQLAEADSILLGAVGFPGVPDHISLWGLLIPIRRGFDQYVNLRPCKLMPGVHTPLAGSHGKRHRFLCRARKHRGRIQQRRRRACFPGTEREFVSQQSVFTPRRASTGS